MERDHHRPRSPEALFVVETDAEPWPTDDDGEDGGEDGPTEPVDPVRGVWVTGNPDEIDAEARARRLPYLVTAGVGGVGAAAWGAVELSATLGGPDAASAALTGTVAVTGLAVPTVKWLLRHRIPEVWRRRWWLAAGGAATWIDITAAYGPSWEWTAALALAGAMAWAGWAAALEVPNPDDVPPAASAPLPAPPPAPLPPPAPVPVRPAPAPSRAELVERYWIERVAAGGNPSASRSRLGPREALPTGGTRWLIELDPQGNVGCTQLLTRVAPIARALQLKSTDVLIERLPGRGDREDLAVLTVVGGDHLADVPYRGPRYTEDHRIPYGLYADGTGEAEWIACDDTGPRSGVITGGQGMGKSVLMALLGMAYRASGRWIVLFGDGDERGISSRLLKRTASDFAAGPAEVLQQLEALEAWHRIRGLLLPGLTDGPDGDPVPMTDPRTQEPVDWIRPSAAYPGFVWFIDELYRLAKDPELRAAQFIPRCARLLRIFRKTGGAIIVGTQSLGSGDFGGDAAFRGMLAQGNQVALRSLNKAERYSVGDLSIAPATLPEGGGYGVASNGARAGMLRVEYSKNMDLWISGLPQTQPDERSGAVYARHRAVKVIDPVAEAAQRRAELAAWDAALAAGTALPGDKPPSGGEATPTAGSPTSVGGVPVPSMPAPKPRAAQTTPSPTPAPVQVPSVVSPPAAPAKVAPLNKLGPAPLSPSAAQVLATLRSRPGVWPSAELIKETGLSGSVVTKACKTLVARGLAEEVGEVHGRYAATA